MVLWNISFYNNIQNTLDIGNRVGLTDYIDFFKIHKNIHFDLEEWRFFIKNNLII